MRQLGVYMNDVKAGILTELTPGQGYVFQYDEGYVSSPHPAISLTLPKRNEAYKADGLFPFFTNMLPEGANRKAICRYRHIDEHDFFGLLTVMADNDFIGAVNVRTIK